MDFLKSMAIAASGLRAQSGRMRVIAENIANADSTAQRRSFSSSMRNNVAWMSPIFPSRLKLIFQCQP